MKVSLKLLFFLFFISIVSFSYGQSIILKGKLVNRISTGPLAGVNIYVQKVADSSVVATVLTDGAGVFEISLPVGKDLFLTASLVGFRMYRSEALVLSAPLNLGTIGLEEQKTSLNEVSVIGKKQFIVQKNDRITFNAENSLISNSGTVYDMLQKLPGVTIDASGNVSLKGKQGVKIYLNGRQSYLSASDLATLLKSQPSTNVSTIDIISNPSAKYDASGNSGIIIINTKKNVKDLYAISINSTTGVGKYLQTNNGLNLAVNRKNLHLNGGYSYTNNNTFRYSDLDRIVSNDEGVFNFKQLSEAKIRNAGSTYNFNGSVDLDDRNKLGFSVDGFINDNKVKEHNNTYINTPPSRLDSSLLVSNNEINKTNLFSSGLSYDLKTDTSGGKIHTEVNYSDYNRDGTGTLLNNYYDQNGDQKRDPLLLRNLTPTKIHIFTAQLDVNGLLPLGISYETGGKLSSVSTDNDYRFETFTGNKFVVNKLNSNHFKYDEDVYAGYVNFSRKYASYTFQAGLRLEHTNSDANSVTNMMLTSRSYTNLFPSVFIQKDINADNQVNLNYSRRIDRPDYQDLNPFVYYNDQYTYTVGNPFLKPQFSDNFQLSYTYKQITFSAGYSRTKDVITQITEQVDSSKITYSTLNNLNKLTNYNLSISYPVSITKWWDSYTYLEGYRNSYESELSGQKLDNGRFTVNVFTEQDIKIVSDLYATVSFNYRSSAYNGIFFFKPAYFLNTGFRKKFFSNKLSAKLSFDDILKSQKTRVITNYANMNYQLESGRDTRRVLLGLSYAIGANKNRSGAGATMNKEERRRIKRE